MACWSFVVGILFVAFGRKQEMFLWSKCHKKTFKTMNGNSHTLTVVCIVSNKSWKWTPQKTTINKYFNKMYLEKDFSICMCAESEVWNKHAPIPLVFIHELSGNLVFFLPAYERDYNWFYQVILLHLLLTSMRALLLFSMGNKIDF